MSKYVFERLNVRIPAWFTRNCYSPAKSQMGVNVSVEDVLLCEVVSFYELLSFKLQHSPRVKPFHFVNNDSGHNYCNSYVIDTTIKQVIEDLEVSVSPSV